jgi:predicted Kef-type K+ transport protein
VRAFAELGVVFLLFVIGLELEPGRLWEMRGQLVRLGLSQLAVDRSPRSPQSRGCSASTRGSAS